MRALAAAALAVTTLGASWAAGGIAPATASAASARFTATGAAVLPVGYREWRHIGTRLKPKGVNILDGRVTDTPEFFNAYVEPAAMKVFERTGRWPEGAQIVKEFTAIRVGAGCDGRSLICNGDLGAGIFETRFSGLGYMVKDSRRFPKSPGSWGYFSFGHQAPPYLPTANFNPSCVGCHVGLASRTDYVIEQAHIGLQRTGGR